MSDSGAQYREGGGDSFPPYMEDYFQRIVNVNWGTGLAVEFGDKAGDPPPSPKQK